MYKGEEDPHPFRAELRAFALYENACPDGYSVVSDGRVIQPVKEENGGKIQRKVPTERQRVPSTTLDN